MINYPYALDSMIAQAQAQHDRMNGKLPKKEAKVPENTGLYKAIAENSHIEPTIDVIVDDTIALFKRWQQKRSNQGLAT